MKTAQLILATFLLSIAGCSNSSNPVVPFSNYSLRGTVHDTNGDFIDSAKIFVIFNSREANQLPKHNILKKISKTDSAALDSFSLRLENYAVYLTWITSRENDSYGFEIQRKQEYGVEFAGIGFIPGIINSDSVHRYSFTDRNLSTGKYYYRLKMVDLDGTYFYSDTLECNIQYIPQTSVLNQNYPNPFDTSTTIIFELRKLSFVTLNVMDLSCTKEIVQLLNSNFDAGRYSVMLLSRNTIPSGGYILLMTIKDPDSSYILKKNILLTYGSFDSTIIMHAPNAISNKGIFVLNSSLPVGYQYYVTGLIDPIPIDQITVSNKIDLIVYKPGFKIFQKDVNLLTGSENEVDVTLEKQ